MPDPNRDISPQRKAAFYIGIFISILGVLTFVSNFVLGPSVHDHANFEAGMHSVAVRAITGMALMVVGAVISQIGRSGAAGSGIVLDPRQARKDLEPWNRAQGGMISDTLEEAAPTLNQIIHPPTPSAPVVKVRCAACHELNDEDAKFCKSCGKPL